MALLLRWNNLPLDRRRFAPEYGDDLAMLIADLHVVNAGTARQGNLFGVSRQQVVKKRRLEKFDIAARSDSRLVLAIAGIGEGRIGQAEDHATVAGIMALYHVGPDWHAGAGVARSYVGDLDAHALCGKVARVHGRGDDGRRRRFGEIQFVRHISCR